MDRKLMVGAQAVPLSGDLKPITPRCGPNGPIEANNELSQAPAPPHQTAHTGCRNDGGVRE